MPVSWVKTVPADQAINFKGKYGNQNSASAQEVEPATSRPNCPSLEPLGARRTRRLGRTGPNASRRSELRRSQGLRLDPDFRKDRHQPLAERFELLL